MTLTIDGVTDELEVSITFLEAQKAPYSFFETLGIHNYQIVDKDGKAVVKEAETAGAIINNGQVEVVVSLTDVPVGEYKLIVTELVGDSKADQPLVVSGNWECGFTKSQ